MGLGSWPYGLAAKRRSVLVTFLTVTLPSPSRVLRIIGRSTKYLQELNGLSRGLKNRKTQRVRCEVRVVQLDSPPTLLGRHQKYFQAMPKTLHDRLSRLIRTLVVEYAPVYSVLLKYLVYIRSSLLLAQSCLFSFPQDTPMNEPGHRSTRRPYILLAPCATWSSLLFSSLLRTSS